MTQKKMKYALAALLAIGATTATAHAQDGTAVEHNGLNINGAVGNPLNPTANIPNQGSYRVQGGYYDLGDLKVDNDFFGPSGNSGSFGEDFADTKFYGVHVAGRPWKAPVELSAGVEKLRVRGNTLQSPANANNFEFDELDTTSFSLGAKWQVWKNEGGDTFVAVGGGYSRALFNNWNVYAVGTKSINVGRRGILTHLGIRYDRFKVEGEDFIPSPPPYRFEDDSRKVSIFAGAEVPIDRQGRWSLIGEVGSKNAQDFNFGEFTFPAGIGDGKLKPKIPYSASIRYANRGWSANVGILRQGVANDSGLFAQIGKTF